MIWNVTDFRAWWTSSARYHWLRAVRLGPSRDLTNFGGLRQRRIARSVFALPIKEHSNVKTKHTLISRFGSVALIGLVVLAQLMTAVVAHAASITLNWSFNYTVDSVCTTTVTKNCVTGFEYGTTPDGGTTLVKIGIAANPATTAASGATSISVQFPQGPPYGSVVFYARTMSLDANGNAVFSAVAPSAQITPVSPSNLVITVK